MTEDTSSHQQQLHITGSVEVTGIPYTQPVVLTVTSNTADESASEPTITFQGISVQGSMQVSGIGENFIMNLCVNEETEEGYHQTINTYSHLQEGVQICSLCLAAVHNIEQHKSSCVEQHIEYYGHNLKGRASTIGSHFYYINLNCVSCPFCNENIHKHCTMVSHIVNHHSAIFDYICRLCPYTNDDIFTSLSHAREHNN